MLVLSASLLGCGGEEEPDHTYTFTSEDAESLFDWCVAHKENIGAKHLIGAQIGEVRISRLGGEVDCGWVVEAVEVAVNAEDYVNELTVRTLDKKCVVQFAKSVITNSSTTGCHPQTVVSSKPWYERAWNWFWSL